MNKGIFKTAVVLVAFACALSAHGESSAAASDLTLQSGMSIIDPSLLTAIFTGMAAVIGSISTLMWCKHKAGKAQRPLDTDDTYVTHGECKSHRCALEKRIDTIGPTLERIFKKLTEIDRKDEDRINSVHRRVDPLIEKLSETRGKIEALEDRIRDAAAAATIGGTK